MCWCAAGALMIEFLVGIDGGGTATRALLASRDGDILGRGTAGPSGLAHGAAPAWNQVRLATQRAFEAAGLFEAAKPTIAEGETLADLLADRSAYEDFDADASGARETNYVALNQLALDHLIG